MYTGQFMSNFIEAIRTLKFLPPNWRKRYLQLYHQKPIQTKIALVASLVFFLSLLSASVFITLLFSGGFGSIPTKDSLKNIDHNLASEVYTADGVLLGRYYIENRLPSSLEEIPDCLKHALIAAEDSRFYQHNGIDFRALGRVLVKSILMQRDESGGGSTITQQLAKNLFPRQKFWFFSLPINKAREMAIATRLEKVYSKEEILALYLNTIPFSGNVFGIKTASMRFFNTSPKNLEPEQAAVLVGMLKATTAYHPKRNPERSKERRNQDTSANKNRSATKAYLWCWTTKCASTMKASALTSGSICACTWRKN
jgi:penicillin-binding protein 1A